MAKKQAAPTTQKKKKPGLTCPGCGSGKEQLSAIVDGYEYGGDKYHEIRCSKCSYSFGLLAKRVEVEGVTLV